MNAALDSGASKGPVVSERYRLETVLGRGGMAVVYRAVDQVTGRVVALKLLEAKGAPEAALFEQEYRTLASLVHPRVIDVFDFGLAEDGSPYYTMELLDGQDLYALSPLPWQTLCKYLRDIATSLLLLHARRLVHRDVSPRNVRLDASGRAKLLDFGAVASFGIASEMVGTPVCTAPEVLRQEPLDQRTDLFSLGVLAYLALTKTKPYPIAHFHEAERAWATPPIPPTQLVPDIPRALEALVLSLVSVDPAGRPTSAAEVIDRLGAIASVDDQTLGSVAESHLVSCPLVGREREREQLRQHLQRALRGQGGVVVVEGAAGCGRSRLAADLAINARVAGMRAACVNAKTKRDANGAFASLLRAVLDQFPVTAQRALSSYPMLARVLDSNGLPHPANGPSPLLFDSGERRAQLQSDFVSWVLGIAEQKPMLVLIDDADSLENIGAGAVIGLAHALRTARVLLVAMVANLADAPIGVQQLVRVGARVKLRPLELPAVEQLVTSAIGDVPHRTRLSRWLYATSGGNPSQAIELLEDLVRRGIVRYENGAWVLPAVLREEALPGSITELLNARVAALSPDALHLARLLALHRGIVSEALCRRLLPSHTGERLRSLIAELVGRQIVVEAAGEVRLAHEPLRPLLLDGVPKDQTALLHVALGNALVGDVMSGHAEQRLPDASVAELCDILQAGWHLLHGGEEARGRDLLRLAGIELTLRGDGFSETVPALEAALEAYRKRGLSRFQCAPLLVPLTLAGNWTDWRLSYRYGDELLEIAGEVTGMALARRLARFLPKPLALALALVIAFVSQCVTPRRRIARSFKESLLGFFGLASAILGTCSAVLDAERARRVLSIVEPLSWFPAKHAVRLVYEFQLALVECSAGRYAESRARACSVLDTLRRPGGLRGVSDAARRQLEVGAYMLIGNMACYRLDGSVHDTIAALDAQGSAAAHEGAINVRANYHANRGEHLLFERYREEMDVLAARGGSTWRPDVLIPRSLWWIYTLCEDVLGLKRMLGHLQTVGRDHPGLASTRDAADACYLAERGMARQALERYEALFEAELRAEVRQPTVPGLRLVAAYARILRANGQPERAKAVCESVLRSQTPAALEFECLSHVVRLELALASAESGESAAALASLRALLAAQHAHDNPLLHGLTHKALAQVALMQRDAGAFSEQLQAMRHWFGKTENPALLAQCERLSAAGRAAGLITGAVATTTRDPDHVKVNAAFCVCRGPAERLQTALDLIIQSTGAAHGYLYVLEPAGLRFAAPAVGFEPPEALLGELGQMVAALGNAGLETEIAVPAAPEELETVVCDDMGALPLTALQGSAYRALPLITSGNGELVVVGVVALVQGQTPLEPLRVSFLEEVARGIYDAGDVRTVYFGQRA